MNPNDEITRNRTFRAVEHSYRILEPFRKLAAGLVEESAGEGYGQPRTRRTVLINLLQQMQVAHTMSLVANRPRVTCESDSLLLRAFAQKFALALNNLIKEISLETTLRQWVQDTFWAGAGFVKVHLADAGVIEIEPDLFMDPGKPFASNVSLDNWVHDTGSNKWSKMQFAGDWYRLPLAAVQESPAFDPRETRSLAPTTKYSAEERQDELSRGQEAVDYDELEPMVDLCDLWFPAESRIFTFALDSGQHFRPKGKPLGDIPLDKDFCPYKKLGFLEIPENIMPASPAAQVAGLARIVNSLARKASRQAHRQKDVHTYTAAGAGSAKKLQRASDGEWHEVNDPKDIGLVKMGGPDASNMAFLDWAMATTDRMAGNITAKMGLGAQAPTKGQEELIHGAVDGVEANMAQRVYEATVDLVQSLGQLLWKDQAKVIPGTIAIQGAEEFTYDATWTPDERLGDFLDYNIGIDVHSMPYQSPERKAALFDALLQKYLSLGPLLTAQGGTINIQRAVELDAELHNDPRIKELIQFTSLVEPDLSEEMGMPSETTRNYVRTSVRGGGTEAAQQGDRQAQWAQLAASQQDQGATAA